MNVVDPPLLPPQNKVEKTENKYTAMPMAYLPWVIYFA